MGTIVEIALGLIAICAIVAVIVTVIKKAIPVIVTGVVLYLLFKLVSLLSLDGVGHFLLQLIAMVIALFVSIIIGICLQHVCANKTNIRFIVNGLFVLILAYLITTDNHVAWYTYVYLGIVAVWSNKKLSTRNRAMKLIGRCEDFDIVETYFFMGLAASLGTILTWQMNFSVLQSTWTYVVMALIGIILLAIADWRNLEKAATDVIGILSQNGFLKVNMDSKVLARYKFTNANEIRDNILNRIDRNEAFVTLSGKYNIIFRKDVLERVEIGVKEHRTTSAIQAELQSKLKVNMPPKMIDVAIGALNVEIGQEYSPINKGFMLIKYGFRSNPSKEGNVKHRRAYYHIVRHIVASLTNDSEAYPQLWERMRNELALPAKVDTEACNLDKCVRELCNTGLTMRWSLRFVHVDDRYAAILEAFYLLDLQEGHLKYDALQEWADKLGLKKDETKTITAFLEMTFKPQSDLRKYIDNTPSGHLRQGMEYLLRNIEWNRTFINLPRYEVAVCAPMSSGKSTFVNAILGYDYIPSSNQACTAKVTSIADNDELTQVMGCTVTKEGKRHFEANVGYDTLLAWNEDADIDRILLEGNLQNIESQKGVLVVDDTPGTNYAEDASHKKQTMDFLQERDVDLILFIINGQHTSTDDTNKLLLQIKENILDKRGTEVLFLINKMDTFDEEKGDNISETLQNLREDLTAKGFADPTVLPIAANAARIFQKALRQEQMTKRELREFVGLYEQFGEDGFDLTKPEWIGANRPDKKIVSIQSTKVTVNGKEYDSQMLELAMQRTGIGVVAAYLDEKINGGRTA